jgi:membrane protease YdiL (CAAX protease family)
MLHTLKMGNQKYLNAFYFVLFLYAAWTGAWFLERALESGSDWLAAQGGQFAYWTLMKLLLWVLPSVVLLRLSGLHLSDIYAWQTGKSVLLWGGGAGLALAVAALASRAFSHEPMFAPAWGWSFISGVVVAPLVEELAFRGAVLRTLMLRYRFAAANTITAVFFLGIHLPGWSFQGVLMDRLTNITGGAISILIIGWILGLAAYKSQSVAGSTLAHILNNLFNA